MSSYVVFAKYARKIQYIRTVKCADPLTEKIGELRLPGEKFVTVIGHAGRLTEEKARSIIGQRKNWAEYLKKTLPLPFREEEVLQMLAGAGFRGGAYELMVQLRMEREVEGKKDPTLDPRRDPAIEAIFNKEVKPALNMLSLKEAAIMILNYGLMDGNQVRINQLAKMFGLTRGSIARIIREAIAKMFGSISLSKVKGGGSSPVSVSR